MPLSNEQRLIRNAKISAAFKLKALNRIKVRSCKYCPAFLMNRTTVCKSCTARNRFDTAKRIAVIKTAKGSHSGWAARTKEPSYPEKYFIELLTKENINFVRELRVEKWFIDFAFHDKMIALEIDGGQHEEPERKLSDAIKDSRLSTLGWNVIRIKWYNPVNEKNRNLLYPQIQSFKDLMGL